MQVAYLALDEAGREVRGTLEAAHPGDAALQLRGRGLFPVEVAPAAGPARPAAPGLSWGVVRASDLVLFCGEMALMLRTGLTLLQTLETLAARGPRAPLRAAARRLSEAVQGGDSLSKALERERLFPPLLAHLVRTAEATGELELAFERAAEHVERRAALRQQLLTSLLYPALVVLVAGGVFWFLAVKVVPKFAQFLARRGASLPWSTQALLDVSEFLRGHGLALVLGAAAAAVAVAVARRTERGQVALDAALLRVPLVGGLIRTAAMAHLARTLGLLLRSGLPLLEALSITGGSFEHRSYRRTLGATHERVARGASLAHALDHPTVTPLCLQVVAVGEQTGALEQVLLELAGFYDQRLQRGIRLLASLFEPVVILVVGGIVGFIYLSFFQAVFSLVQR